MKSASEGRDGIAAMAGGLTSEDIRAIPWAYPTGGSDIVYLV
ncbi:hypothetical protein [Bellilinea caldifistulae]|nr:hypothetical protein [Bellilinea caldifistulae]